MTQVLIVSVRFAEGRYHGAGDWPPAPARLFQALVAAAGLTGPLRPGHEEWAALSWLEELHVKNCPTIGAPVASSGQTISYFVPNNDLDKFGGDVDCLPRVRTATKVASPRLFNASIPLLYAWQFKTGRDHAETICKLSERLYQLGRGIDIAWAWGEVVEDADLETRLSRHEGRVYRPSPGTDGVSLLCPRPGSLESLEARHRAFGQRFSAVRIGKTLVQSWTRPPPPNFCDVRYESSPTCHTYELRDPLGTSNARVPWPLARASVLVTSIRDGAARRLRSALLGRHLEIERLLIGRKQDGRDDGPSSERIRIVPLASIGHPDSDHRIRRVLVEVPPTCSLRADDVHWAVSGLDLGDPSTGEALEVVVTPSTDDGIVRHYGADGHAWSTWRTITPAALPAGAWRRRIAPESLAKEKQGTAHAFEEGRAAEAVLQSLGHAGVRVRARTIRVQREPFERSGDRAEAFAAETRFPKECLRHVEVAFDEPVRGPLVIGDGRFLGLGIMAPVRHVRGIHAFAIESGLTGARVEPLGLARALRRAVMSRAQALLGDAALPPFFSGHEVDGSPARSELSSHLAFAFDRGGDREPDRKPRLLVLAPHALDRRESTANEREHLAHLTEALGQFVELRAGSAGCLTVRATAVEQDDPLLAPSRTWESLTEYQVNRHAKASSAGEALIADVREECRRRGLPVPSEVVPKEPHGIPGRGLVGHVRLSFAVAVQGPIALGRSRYLGGGLFRGQPRS